MSLHPQRGFAKAERRLLKGDENRPTMSPEAALLLFGGDAVAMKLAAIAPKKTKRERRRSA